MRFVCDSCRAQYMISDEKIGAKGVKVRCKKCGHVILVRRAQASGSASHEETPTDALNAVTRAEEESTATSDNPEGISSPLAGIEDDEIGAVFDQVLSTSNQKTVEAASESGAGEDEALSTRVLDEEEVKKLAAETADDNSETVEGPHLSADLHNNGARSNGHAGYSNGSNGAHARATNGAYSNGANGAGGVPQQDWFIAIDDRQVGPVPLDDIKTRWEKGEIGPDSLCWRAGFADWLPLSEVAMLKSLLPAQPKKMSIAPAAATPVISVPVESSYNVGGVSRTVRSEVPMAAAAAEETAWKPSAASALASLVKQEIEALTKPAPAPKVEPEQPKVRGIFDVPLEAPAAHEEPVRQEVRSGPGTRAPVLTPAPRGAPVAPAVQTPVPAPMEQANFVPSPYVTPAYHAGVHPAAPKSGRGLLTGVMLGLVAIVLILVGLVAYRVLVQQQPVQTQIAAITPTASPSTAAPATAPATPAPAAAAPSAAPSAPAAVPPAAAPAPAAAAPAQPAQQQPAAQPAPPAIAAAAKLPRGSSRLGFAPKTEVGRVAAMTSRRGEGETITPAREERQERQERRSGGASSDDEFEATFGTGGGKRREDSKPAATTQPKRGNDSVYVPPAPGSADIPERLGQSDIMSVVLSNKPAIVKCVGEQKAKDPGLSGKLIVRWTVKTNGRTSNVSVLNDELRSTHLAGCITGLVKSWKFPAHRVQGDPVDFPFTF